MPTYEFRCNVCGHTYEEYLTFEQHDMWRTMVDPCLGDPDGEDCYGQYEQTYDTFSIVKSWEAGYNPTVGANVNSAAQFRSELSRASDAASARTGLAHNFQPIDPRDPVAAGVDDTGMDKTYDAEVKAGIREPKRYV